MISIQMGGIDFVLGAQWLQSLGKVALNFQDLFKRFSSKGKEIELIGINILSNQNEAGRHSKNNF
jgi:hypothetical protein